MRKNFYNILLIALAISGLCNGCNKWKDHNAIDDPLVRTHLFQQIEENPELSKFAALLVKSGYDQVLASSQNYTVFAPVNAALASLDPAIEADEAKLRLFVGNHITNQVLPAAVTNPVRVPMLNGKYNNLQGMQLEDATITTADSYSKNGLLHIINKMVPALSSAWEFVQKDPLMPASQKNFLLTQIDSAGNNLFLQQVYDLRDEKKQFTFFVLADAAWNGEVNKYKPFYKTVTGSADTATSFAGLAVASDIAVEGVYQPNAIPDTILSKFNTKVGIDKSAIVRTVKVSNGIVYLMNKLDVLPKHKYQPIIIQGENYDFSKFDRRNVTYIRDKLHPLTNQAFRDVLVFNHDNAQYYLGYRLLNVPTIKFKAYWVAVHDRINNNTGTFKQLLGIGTPTSSKLAYTTVKIDDYTEVPLGEFNVDFFNTVLNVYLTADNSTNDDANKITVDYIRLEPVL